MRRGEAVDIFRRWAADGALVRWQGRFAKFAFSSFGRVLSVNDNELRVMAGDRNSELIVQFDDDLQFGYADSTGAPLEEKQYGDCILIFFESPEEDEPDFITLAALDDPLS